jgi:hypothetical protein
LHQVRAQADGPYVFAARTSTQILSPEYGPLIVYAVEPVE